MPYMIDICRRKFFFREKHAQVMFLMAKMNRLR